MKEVTRIGKELTEKQKLFCREYIISGWNATRSYENVYGVKTNIAQAASSRLLLNVIIQTYITELRKDIEKLTGVNKEMLATELRKMANVSIARMHNTWITRKEFEEISEDDKAAIQEIQTQTRTVMNQDVPTQVEYVRIKLFDKKGSIDSLSKMFGYNAAEKKDVAIDLPVIQITERVNDALKHL